MGGTLGRGNVTRLAEFNAWADPEAVRLVLESRVPLRVVGLEVTEQIALDEAGVAALALPDTPRGALVDAALRALCRAERELSRAHVAYLHDPSAIAAASAPELFHFAPAALAVHAVEGEARGRLVETVADTRAVDYARAARARDVLDHFGERVRAWADS
jgi:inosine-uridine nucleoside N-ribohydrolase